MYIKKRWIVPGALSLVLSAFIMASFLANVIAGNRASETPVETFDVAARTPAADAAPTVLVSGAQCDPAAGTGTDQGLSPAQQADLTRYLSAVEANRNSGGGNDFATNSGVVANSQFNDGGFGDIGQQWREVEVAAPITNVHISGTGNTTTVVIGNDNVVNIDPAPAEEPAPDSSLASEAPAAAAPAAPVAEAPAAPVEATPVAAAGA